MPFAVLVIDRLVLVRLRAAPTDISLRDLRAQLTTARADVGRPLIAILQIPEQAEDIPAEMRPLMADFGKYVSRLCQEVHLAIETKGFRGTILRSAITATVMVTRERNLTVHRTLAEAIQAIRHQVPLDRLAEVEALVEPSVRDGTP